jgi:RNA ligase (TIGR02306 family)
MENQNSVCFIAKVNEIKKIEGADNIELALVGGWNCIVKRGAYKVGDLVGCATTDAVIPQGLSDAMNVTNYLRKGQRVRTVKLKGVYSECLIIGNEFLPIGYNSEGKDLMESLGIYKFEPPVKNIQLASGKKIRYSENPNFHVYYKFPNIKNVIGIFTEDDEVQITRKIHGTNARYGVVRKNKLSFLDKIKKFFKVADKWIDYEFVVGSHNVEKGSDSQGYYDKNVWYEINDKYDIKNKLWVYVKNHMSSESIGHGLVVYGEIYGAGIQKNYDYGLKDIQFVGIDISIDGKYQNTEFAEAFFYNYINWGKHLPHVEILYTGKWSQEIQDKFTFNNYIEGTKIPHEGIVIKHVSGERNKIAKVINPEYLTYAEKKDVGDSH